jgi:hypothetical protein
MNLKEQYALQRMNEDEFLIVLGKYKIYIESVTYPIKTETSTILGSIVRDITEQKKR